jgi:WD40 repeat protein
MRETPPSHAQAARLLATVADALHYAHHRGFVHRDLKPSNILIDRFGRPHVGDFGLAIHEDRQRSHKGECAGTPSYMAPEQVRGESHQLDGRTDIWSAGVILYEMLTKRRPFRGDREELFEDILKRDPKPPRQIDDTIPPELERICLKCLAKKTTDRFSTAADLARALSATTMGPPPPQPARRRNRSPWLAWSVTGVLALIALSALVVGQGFLPPTPPKRSESAGSSQPMRVVEPKDKSRDAPVHRESQESRASQPLEFAPPRGETPAAPSAADNPITIEAATDSRRFDAASKLPELAQLLGHTGPVRCVVFSPDGTLLASGGDDQSVKLWDVATWKLRATLRGFQATVHCLAFSPDSSLLAWGGDGFYDMNVRVWDLSANKQAASFRWQEPNSPSRVYAVAFSPMGGLLATGGTGPVRVWDLASGRQRSAFPWQQTFPSYVYGTAFSPDKTTLAAGCHGGQGMSQPESVQVWNVADESKRELLIGDSKAMALSHQDTRGVVAFGPKGDFLARVTNGGDVFTGTADGTLMLWNLKVQIKPTSFVVPGGNVYAMCVFADGVVRLASADGSADSRFGRLGFPNVGARSPFPGPPATNDQPGEVNLWDSTSNEAVGFSADQGQVISLGFSRDAALLASGSDDNSVKVWDVKRLRSAGIRTPDADR